LRDRNGRKNADDGNHHQNFNQRKTGASFHACSPLTGCKNRKDSTLSLWLADEWFSVGYERLPGGSLREKNHFSGRFQ
jgi:hypothetical protein